MIAPASALDRRRFLRDTAFTTIVAGALTACERPEAAARTIKKPGSHMYHSHRNAVKQVGLGLLGAFIVEPADPRPIERVDHDYVFVLNDGSHGFTFNGKEFPATEPLVAKLGEKIRIRFMNEGMMIHPMHLHGMHMTVIDKDGWPLPAPWKCDTRNVAPGERWDVIVNCTNPGTWAFHCHILPHAETDHGMYGMVTALVVQNRRMLS